MVHSLLIEPLVLECAQFLACWAEDIVGGRYVGILRPGDVCELAQ